MGTRYNASPAFTASDLRQPARNSTTARARGQTAIRQGARRDTVRTTQPSPSRKMTSMGKRMNAVWTEKQGISISAAPLSRPVRPSSPRRRAARVSATSTMSATDLRVRSLINCTSEHSGNQMPRHARAVLAIVRIGGEHALLHEGADDERALGNREHDDVPRRGMCREERDVCDEVSGVDRMPHGQIRALHDDAAVGGNEAEAAPERQLA